MKYACTTKTVTTSRSVLDIDVPQALTGAEDAIDKAVYETVRKKGPLPLTDATVITTVETIVEIVRGDKRIFPRERKVPKVKDVEEKR